MLGSGLACTNLTAGGRVAWIETPSATDFPEFFTAMTNWADAPILISLGTEVSIEI